MPSFTYPWFLLLLPLAPLVGRWRWRGRRPALRFSDTRLFAGLSVGRAPLIRRIDCAVYSLCALFLVLALSGPRLPLPTPITTEGIALVMVVDVSGSMHEVDVEWEGARISRLDAATRVFSIFVRGGTTPNGQSFPGRPQDQIALVTFANYPKSVSPLTLSHRPLLEMLKLEQARRPEEGQTNVGDAIAEALLRLETATTRRKAIILLSDGEHNFAGPVRAPTWLPRLAAQRASDLSVAVHAIDVGGDHDDRGFGHQSLRDIAELTSGAYVAATDSMGLQSAYERIDRLERQAIESYQYRRFRELHAPFALAAFVCVLIGGLLQSTWGRRLP